MRNNTFKGRLVNRTNSNMTLLAKRLNISSSSITVMFQPKSINRLIFNSRFVYLGLTHEVDCTDIVADYLNHVLSLGSDILVEIRQQSEELKSNYIDIITETVGKDHVNVLVAGHYIHLPNTLQSNKRIQLYTRFISAYIKQYYFADVDPEGLEKLIKVGSVSRSISALRGTKTTTRREKLLSLKTRYLSDSISKDELVKEFLKIV